MDGKDDKRLLDRSQELAMKMADAAERAGYDRFEIAIASRMLMEAMAKSIILRELFGEDAAAVAHFIAELNRSDADAEKAVEEAEEILRKADGKEVE